jgi:hypothetical protein
MQPKNKFGFEITTYEVNNDNGRLKYNPVITHIGWGKSIDDATGNLLAHLKSDIFFSSSFIGELSWGDTVISLVNQRGELIGKIPFEERSLPFSEELSAEDKISEIMDKLYEEAKKVHREQQNLGIIHAVQLLSKKKI